MDHLKTIQDSTEKLRSDLLVKLTGQFYTHKSIADNSISSLISEVKRKGCFFDEIKIADPFGGDGRLIYWFIKEWAIADMPNVKWDIDLWDVNDKGFMSAEIYFTSLIKNGLNLNINYLSGDTFRISLDYPEAFDIILTNPPWEILKPDYRELKYLDSAQKEEYIKSLKLYDSFISKTYVQSQPKRKFAGWGTNLSRVGLEVTLNLIRKNGFVLIVLPASFFADDQSIKLRKKLLERTNISDISYYPAEAKLFKNADIVSSCLIFSKAETSPSSQHFKIIQYTKDLRIKIRDSLTLDLDSLRQNDYVIPINIDPKAIQVLHKINNNFKPWASSENTSKTGLWAGREIDETRHNDWLSNNGQGPKFVKGKMIDRYKVIIEPYKIVNKPNWTPPNSVNHEKIIWRDVSRPNQKRRIIATIISEGIVAGNSLGVCYYNDFNPFALRLLLGILNSVCFEFQLRAFLATGHISLSSIRKVCIPDRSAIMEHPFLFELVQQALDSIPDSESKIEAYVAKNIYMLTRDEFVTVLELFHKISKDDKTQMIKFYDNY